MRPPRASSARPSLIPVVSAALMAAVALVASVRPGAAHAQDAAPGERVLAFVGGEVRPADGSPYSRGVVLVRGDRIVAVGSDVTIPDEAERIDCTGKVVTPGLIDADSGLGLEQGERTSGRSAADERVADGVDPFDARIRTASEQGVTSWFATGNTRGVYGGVAAVFSVAARGGASPVTLMRDEAGVGINLAESGNAGGAWGAARFAYVREQLVAARDLRDQRERFRRELAEYEAARVDEEETLEERLLLPPEVLDELREWSPARRADWRTAAYKSMGREKEYTRPKTLPGEPRRPNADTTRETLLSLLGAGPGIEGAPDEGAEPVVPSRPRVVLRTELDVDTNDAIQLAREFGLRPVLIGGASILNFASDLANRNVPVVVSQLGDTAQRESGPLTRRDDELVTLLVHTGVKPALGSGDVPGATRWLRLLAAEQIAHGLHPESALACVSLWAARAAGVDDEIGSLTRGKRADLVVWSGDPFRATSRAERVFVGGREVLDAQ